MRRRTSMLNSLLLAGFLLLNLSFLFRSGGFFHGGGVHIIRQIMEAAIRPTLDQETLLRALKACLQTLTYALASIGISFVLAFFISVFASGAIRIPKFLRAAIKLLMSFIRSIHELVWAWFFVVAIGLNPAGAILAISIPYTGALAKVFTELLENRIATQRASLRVFGASSVQCLAYDYLPSVFRDMMSYALYRLECAVRSTASLSFVGLGGIGFLIQLSLQDLNFKSMWTYLYCLVLLVIFVDLLSTRLLSASGKKRRIGLLALAIATVSTWVFLFEKESLLTIFNERNYRYIRDFSANIFDVKGWLALLSDPAFFDALLKLCKETLMMSLYAIALASLLLIPFVLFGSGFFSELAVSRPQRAIARLLRGFANLCFVVSRSVPELLWGMIFVFLFKPGWFPGVLALAIHNFGILGRLSNDAMNSMDKRPIRALQSSGASKVQLILYGVLPMIRNHLILYIFYRWEVIIRTTIVVGFIGAGGLGQALRLAISFFRYQEIGLYIMAYMLMVVLTEWISSKIKRSYAIRSSLQVD